MKQFTLLYSIFILIFFASSIIYSQETPELKVKVNGTVQAWASYAQTNTDTNQVGFGLRRVRARFASTFGKHLKTFIQAELTSPKLLDARIEYIFTKAFQIRVGRFIGAGVRSGGLTSHTVLDIVERPFTAQQWGRETVGADYRDYGLAFLGTKNGFGYNLTLHNGNGKLNLKPSQRTTASVQTSGVAVSGMLFYKPKSVKGLEVGGYYGTGNKYQNDYTSFNGYIYFEPKPLRLKAEYISWTDKNGNADKTSAGFYGFAGYRVKSNIELVARYEQFDPNTNLTNDEQSLITIGATYSFYPAKWKTAKITAAYVIHNEASNAPTIDNNVFYVMGQYVF
ncbi:hypothetical protein BMS3Abin04_01712 [bacterium BMS3Abin04]|nr:hypothetical protein BMS3Abin04_01712 [bacterium BMS3Abin04]